ncbi:hypothetical protein BELL_0045g00260 [Botrytis elliptica]|uniref:Uncharacterized protein n=1 Tax=Botrytis elliptica TaxID=278938 RepID=A0A4Z1KCW8_9HELO|nr:hypothetical protein BELL_0045g00260 [Botrytis elliptica]
MLALLQNVFNLQLPNLKPFTSINAEESHAIESETSQVGLGLGTARNTHKYLALKAFQVFASHHGIKDIIGLCGAKNQEIKVAHLNSEPSIGESSSYSEQSRIRNERRREYWQCAMTSQNLNFAGLELLRKTLINGRPEDIINKLNP